MKTYSVDRDADGNVLIDAKQLFTALGLQWEVPSSYETAHQKAHEGAASQEAAQPEIEFVPFSLRSPPSSEDVIVERHKYLLETIQGLQVQNEKLSGALSSAGASLPPPTPEKEAQMQHASAVASSLCHQLGIDTTSMGLPDTLYIDPNVDAQVKRAYENSPLYSRNTPTPNSRAGLGSTASSPHLKRMKENKACSSPVAAFHERKLIWAARELGRAGLDRIVGWFQKMDNENRGFLSHRCIAMAMSESGGAELSERELRSVTSGMKHNRRKELDYQELLSVMYGMINLSNESDNYVTGDHVASVLHNRSSAINRQKEEENGSLPPDMEDILISVRTQCIRMFSFEQVPKMVRRPFHKRDPDAEGTMSVATFVAALDEIGLVLHPQEVGNS